jgi:nucleotidyltransferase/DNA polymerase involved in DNA repair
MPLCIGRANGQSVIAWQTIAVGGSENRGVVAAASYEARKFEFEACAHENAARRIR